MNHISKPGSVDLHALVTLTFLKVKTAKKRAQSIETRNIIYTKAIGENGYEPCDRRISEAHWG